MNIFHGPRGLAPVLSAKAKPFEGVHMMLLKRLRKGLRAYLDWYQSPCVRRVIAIVLGLIPLADGLTSFAPAFDEWHEHYYPVKLDFLWIAMCVAMLALNELLRWMGAYQPVQGS